MLVPLAVCGHREHSKELNEEAKSVTAILHRRQRRGIPRIPAGRRVQLYLASLRTVLKSEFTGIARNACRGDAVYGAW